MFTDGVMQFKHVRRIVSEYLFCSLRTNDRFILNMAANSNHSARAYSAPIGGACATITALTVLENPRTAPGLPLSPTFDAHLWLDPAHEAIAALRYYNGTNLSFQDVGIYLIHANVCGLIPRKTSYSLISSLNYLDSRSPASNRPLSTTSTQLSLISQTTTLLATYNGYVVLS